MHILSQLMSEFVGKKKLPARCQISSSFTQAGEQYLHISDPVVLARFISFVKSRAPADNEIFMRGQIRDYPGMVPALFRCDDREFVARATLYRTLIQELHTALPHDRFRRDNMGAMLQHYGIQTPWIDLVDNLFVALWFAQNRFDPARNRFVPSVEEHGWIYLMAVGSAPSEMRWVDLRKRHSSMNTRLQAQHGISAASQNDYDDVTRFDYSDYVVARIRFPTTSRFKLGGHLFKMGFMFPPPDLDETHDLILKSTLNELAERLEEEAGFTHPILGRAFRLRYRGAA